MSGNQLAFVMLHAPLNELGQEHNKVTSFLNGDEVDEVQELSVTRTPGLGHNTFGIGILYEKSAPPEKHQTSVRVPSQPGEPAKKRPKPRPLT